MADQITASLYLSIAISGDTINFATPAFDVKNIEVLLDGPDVRGSDRLLPTSVGVKAYKRRATVSRRLLQLQIYGHKTRTGATNSDPFQGLIDNIALLRTVTDPYGTGDGTRTATLHFPDSSTKTASVHVISPVQIVAEAPWFARGILTLDLIAGSFS